MPSLGRALTPCRAPRRPCRPTRLLRLLRLLEQVQPHLEGPMGMVLYEYTNGKIGPASMEVSGGAAARASAATCGASTRTGWCFLAPACPASHHRCLLPSPGVPLSSRH